MSLFDRRTILKCAVSAAGASLLAKPALAQSVKTLRYGSLFNPDHTSSRSSDKFAQLVEQKTGGKVKVQVYHNAQLGNETQVGEGIRTGTIDVGFAGSSGFGSYIRDIRVLELPYLYKDFEALHRVYLDVFPTLTDLFGAAGVQLVGNIYEGPRMTLATRSLRTLEDFKGLKLRVPQAPVYIEFAKALGAIPTPVALPEVYTALQAKVADGLEGAPSTLLTGKYYEVAKNLLRTDHIFNATYIGVNLRTFKAFDPAIQAAILEAGREATVYNLGLVKQAAADDMDKLEKTGITIVTPDVEPFRAAVEPANEAYAASLGGKAQELLAKAKEIGRR
jgi:tripartite ATP-independent transporter DctP family solute receptor